MFGIKPEVFLFTTLMWGGKKGDWVTRRVEGMAGGQLDQVESWVIAMCTLVPHRGREVLWTA